jgi:hypothetical protein
MIHHGGHGEGRRSGDLLKFFMLGLRLTATNFRELAEGQI